MCNLLEIDMLCIYKYMSFVYNIVKNGIVVKILKYI